MRRTAAKCSANTSGPVEARPTIVLAAAGCIALALGALVYLTDRAAPFVLPGSLIGLARFGMYFGAFAQWLPTFLHVIAFSLLTAATLVPRARPAYGACVLWCAVNVAFELGQHPALSASLAEALDVLAAPPALGRYFVRGTFDGGDIAAAALGALVAAALLRLVRRPFGVKP